MLDNEPGAEGGTPEASGGPAPAVPLFQPPQIQAAPAKPARAEPEGATAEAPAQDRAEEPSEGRSGRTRTRERSKGSGRSRSERSDAGGRGGRNEEETSDDGAQDSDDRTYDDADTGDSDEGDDAGGNGRRRRRRRGGRRRGKGDAEGAEGDDGPDGRGDEADDAAERSDAEDETDDPSGSRDTDAGSGSSSGSRRRRRRRRRKGEAVEAAPDDPEDTVVRLREPRKSRGGGAAATVGTLDGSTRLEAKKQRRREGREAGRRRPPILTEAEFLARRESVDRAMVIRQDTDRTQIGVLEDKVLVEHYVAENAQTSMIGNVYLGRVQNVLPSMEAAFIDIGRGRNAVLYAGEVDWAGFGVESGQAKRIESVLKSGQAVLVQVTKDPIGHKGARLTSQISLPGRYLVYVPGGSMNGISRKLPDTERNRLKNLLKDIVPADAGVVVRTAAEGASEDELSRDVSRLRAQWDAIETKSASGKAPELVYSEPDLLIKVVRDLFTEDFTRLVVSGEDAFEMVEGYVKHVAPHLMDRVERWTSPKDLFHEYRIDEQIAKALDRKVWLPSGGSLVIERTEAMTVIDVNTGKFTGSGGNLEETVTKNNLEAAEEIVRQLRLRDVGGIIVVDFIDMVLESNRELVLRRLVECLGRDRTKHQVAEVTSLGLVQMTRKRIGTGLLESFSESCEACRGRGVTVRLEPATSTTSASSTTSSSSSGGGGGGESDGGSESGRRGRRRRRGGSGGGNGGSAGGNGGDAGSGNSGGEADGGRAVNGTAVTHGSDSDSGPDRPEESTVPAKEGRSGEQSGELSGDQSGDRSGGDGGEPARDRAGDRTADRADAAAPASLADAEAGT